MCSAGTRLVEVRQSYQEVTFMPNVIFGNEDFIDPFFPKEFDKFYKDWFVLEDPKDGEEGLLGKFCVYGREYAIEKGAKGKRPADNKQNATKKTSEFFKVSVKIGEEGDRQVLGASESLETAAQIVHHHCWEVRTHAVRVMRTAMPQPSK